MKKFRSVLMRFAVSLAAAAAALSLCAAPFQKTMAAELSAGEYELSGELSAYLAAMGGVEFGGPLMSGISLVIDEDGNEYLKLTFTKSSVTIYSITCDTFVDASPSTVTTTRGVEDGVIGIYDADGNLVTDGVEYTLSEDTALNSADEEVNYVDSATFPISTREETYNLALYINSNVMGVEFCNDNDDATETTYQATLTVDWSNIEALEASEETTTASETEEETEEESLEANEELEGLAIYEADSDPEDSSESASSANMAVIVIIIVVIVIIVIAVIVVIVVVCVKKNNTPADEKAACGVSDETVVIKKEGLTEAEDAADDTAVINKEDIPSEDK